MYDDNDIKWRVSKHLQSFKQHLQSFNHTLTIRRNSAVVYRSISHDTSAPVYSSGFRSNDTSNPTSKTDIFGCKVGDESSPTECTSFYCHNPLSNIVDEQFISATHTPKPFRSSPKKASSIANPTSPVGAMRRQNAVLRMFSYDDETDNTTAAQCPDSQCLLEQVDTASTMGRNESSVRGKEESHVNLSFSNQSSGYYSHTSQGAQRSVSFEIGSDEWCFTPLSNASACAEPRVISVQVEDEEEVHEDTDSPQRLRMSAGDSTLGAGANSCNDFHAIRLDEQALALETPLCDSAEADGFGSDSPLWILKKPSKNSPLWAPAKPQQNGRRFSCFDRPQQCPPFEEDAVVETRKMAYSRQDSSSTQVSRKERRSSLAEIGFGKIESYTKLNKLGQGTYASVFRGRSCLTESPVALKEICLEHSEGVPCTAIREISILRELRHANVVTLHDIVYTEKKLTLVFEFVEGDLKQYMEGWSSRVMPLHNVRLLMYQLLRGLKFCHQRHILHRDLKPQNLLITASGDLKLADFGLARAKSIPCRNFSHDVVTLWYRPPDVLLGSTQYSTHIDMWGVGCILYEMVTGSPCFPASSVREELACILKLLGTPTEVSWPGISTNKAFLKYKFHEYPGQSPQKVLPRLCEEGQDLFLKLLRYNNNSRLAAAQALQHEYFTRNLPYQELQRLPDTCSIFQVSGMTMESPSKSELQLPTVNRLAIPRMARACSSD